MKIRDMCMSAVMAALLCLIGPLTVPAGPVPVSLAGFGICLAGGVLGPRRGGTAVLVYILLGMAGLPVFAGFAGGAAHLLGPTGGFIAGYLPCAVIAGSGRWIDGWKWRLVPGMVAGTLVMYILGTAWFVVQTGMDAGAAIAACVAPFVVWDALKIAAASMLSEAVLRTMRK